MIDTILILSPYISIAVAKAIELFCVKRSGIDLNTGNVIYELTTGTLKGSWDSRLSLRVMYTEFINISGRILEVKSEPYLRVEVSVHKFILGHNIYGGSEDYDKLVKYIVNFIEKISMQELPEYKEWYPKRIDYAMVFDLINKENCYAWIEQNIMRRYPRRKTNFYDDKKHNHYNGLYFSGTTTTWKAYHKGDDFREHDKNRLMKYAKRRRDMVDSSENFLYNIYKKNVLELENIADSLIRIELEIKSKRLEELFGDNCKVKDIKIDLLKSLFDEENKKIFKEGNEMEIVRNSKQVEERLYATYTKQMARSLLSTWYSLSVHGELHTRNLMARNTWYVHVNNLIAAGVSWTGTDVIKSEIKNTKSLEINKILLYSNSIYVFNKKDDRLEKLLNEVA